MKSPTPRRPIVSRLFSEMYSRALYLVTPTSPRARPQYIDSCFRSGEIDRKVPSFLPSSGVMIRVATAAAAVVCQ